VADWAFWEAFSTSVGMVLTTVRELTWKESLLFSPFTTRPWAIPLAPLRSRL
jgi:hypothetical protein